ncbi:hypothetical protein L6452_06317 [Arctium lappa]|uniref:Uncharacterized protein n=1 Tax=Arctium lappa TaxID=4217 RepID=A0ACB9EIW7_ARCLA|nr:hypothetical protein L6452_06317 [Arctium lappa]
MASSQPQTQRPESNYDASQEQASQIKSTQGTNAEYEFWQTCASDVDEAEVIGFVNCGKDEVGKLGFDRNTISRALLLPTRKEINIRHYVEDSYSEKIVEEDELLDDEVEQKSSLHIDSAE